MDLTAPSFLYGMDLEEAEAAVQNLGAPKYRARQILECLYRKHVGDLAEARNLPADLRSRLAEKYSVSGLKLCEMSRSAAAESVKYLFQTAEGHFLESVLICQRDRRTVCVSTQLGCKIGCTFCASGKGKFGRNLTAGEIVEQVAQIERSLKNPGTGPGMRSGPVPSVSRIQSGPVPSVSGPVPSASSVSNVVFMGMGEPLDNFEATMKALRILQAPWGFGLGARRITVSTSGITPKIVEFVKRSEGRVRLSVSLHSSDDRKRSELVPINRRYGLRELIETLAGIRRKLKREITFEYTLIGGVNDSREEAEGVAEIARPLRAKVNLIPYNPIREMDYKVPSTEAVENFRAVLQKKKVRVIVRQTAGRDINAACGQLRLIRENPRNATAVPSPGAPGKSR